MCGLDVTNQAILTPDYLATLPELNRTGKMLHALFSHYRSGSMQSGLRMHDLCAIAWLVRGLIHPQAVFCGSGNAGRIYLWHDGG